MAKAEAAAYGARQRSFNGTEQLRAAVLASPWPAGGLTVRVQFHVVHWQGYSSVSDTSTPPVDSRQISRQLAVINKDYKATGIKYVMAAAPMFHSNQQVCAAGSLRQAWGQRHGGRSLLPALDQAGRWQRKAALDWRRCQAALPTCPFALLPEQWTAKCQDSLEAIYNALVVSPTTTLNIVVCDLVSQGGVLG